MLLLHAVLGHSFFVHFIKSARAEPAAQAAATGRDAVLQLLTLLLNLNLLRRARRARRTRRAWTCGTLPRRPGTVGRDGWLRILWSHARVTSFPPSLALPPVSRILAKHHNLAHSPLRTNSRRQPSTHSRSRAACRPLLPRRPRPRCGCAAAALRLCCGCAAAALR